MEDLWAGDQVDGWMISVSRQRAGRRG